jgi:para-nitrobenzyl esterase
MDPRRRFRHQHDQSSPACDCTNQARKGVVLVSVAYRAGPMGLLARPEFSAESGKGSGAYGIQDRIAGLRWVKENVAKFGGDPSNVTIFGKSAGAYSVCILAGSPMAHGLLTAGHSRKRRRAETSAHDLKAG